MRLTCPVLPPYAVPDSTAEIVDIAFAAPSPDLLPAECLIAMPKAIYVKIDDLTLEFLPPKPCHQHVVCNETCEDCVAYPGVVQITPQTKSWIFKQADTRSFRVKRTAYPIWSETACGLYTMQGKTDDPGMIEGSLEVKLPTIWTDEKHSQEAAEPGTNSEPGSNSDV